MSYNRVQPIKSEGKRKRELTAVVRKINGFFGRYREELGNLNPNNVTDRTKAEKYFRTQTKSLRCFKKGFTKSICNSKTSE